MSSYRYEHVIIGLLLSITLLFPILGLFLNLFYYLVGNPSFRVKKVLLFNLTLAMAYVGWLYYRVDHSGDVYRYAISLENYKNSLLTWRKDILADTYEAFYPLWYFIFFLISKVKQNIQFLNAIAGFSIYGVMFYIVYYLDKTFQKKSIDKLLVLKIFILVSFVGLYSSYKTMWTFALIMLGVTFLLQKNIYGYIFLLLGVLIHPVAVFPIIVFAISNFVEFQKRYFYIALVFGVLFAKKILEIIFSFFSTIPFLGSKIHTYIYGEWGKYRFQDNAEYIKFMLLVTIILFVLYILYFNFINLKKNSSIFLNKYNNFIMWYATIGVLFFSFRTIELRIFYDGSIFFIPLFYQFLGFAKFDKLYKSFYYFILLIWLFMIDVRLFNIFNSSYQIGDGFPFNLIESPWLDLLKGINV